MAQATEKKLNQKTYKSTGIKYLSPAWESKRKSLGIGGSEASAIVGMNPYMSAFSVFWDKVNGSAPKEISEAMRQGSDLEEYVAQRFCAETGKKVKRNSFMLQSIKYPFMLADVDRFVVGENALVECKCTLNSQGYSYADADNIPAYHLIQCLHYMSVVGVDKVYLATLVYGKGFYIVEIDRSKYESDITALIEIEERFWNNNIKPGIPPVADGSKSSSNTLTNLFPQEDDSLPVVDLTPQAKNLARLSEIKQEIATLTAEKDTIENSIKQQMGAASKGVFANYQISRKTRDRISIDTKSLKSQLPEIYEQFAKKSTTRTFLFTEKN